MANAVDETGAHYISKLNVDGATYTIKDEWVRAELDEVKTAITGGVHFRGVSDTAIADGDNVKTISLAGGGSVDSAEQVDGDIFIYNNGTKNLEFVVSGGKYSEFGSTGELGALAFADSAAGSATVPIASSITFNTFTPNVGLGSLGVTTTEASLGVATTEASASGTFSPAAITIAASTVTLTPTKASFSALKDVTYDSASATLTILNGTSDEFWTGATGQAAGQTVTPTANQAIAVTYDKATGVTGSAIASAALDGSLTVTGAKPTATITDPTITVTVTPVSD